MAKMRYEIGPVDGPYRKVEITTARRCRKKRLGHQCRGVSGHCGQCWHYRDDGWLVRWGGGHGYSEETPPGHARYVTPADKLADDYASRHTSRVVGKGRPSDRTFPREG